MLTPKVIHDSLKEFQDEAIDADLDYCTLTHQKTYLESKLLQKKYLTKRLQLIYSQIDKTRNYQEFVDVLMNSKSLLREIFTLEGQNERLKTVNGSEPEIYWSKFGLDVSQYIANDDHLLALYNDGLL